MTERELLIWMYDKDWNKTREQIEREAKEREEADEKSLLNRNFENGNNMHKV